MDYIKIGCDVVGWIHLAQNREHGNDPSGCMKEVIC
jgi:hypothetical protein